MTIAEVKALADGKITVLTAKIAALRALLVTHVGTADWSVDRAKKLMADIDTANALIAEYTAFKTAMDTLDTKNTAVAAAYAAARLALENDAALGTVATLDADTATLKSTYETYLATKGQYDYSNGTAAATVLANFEAGRNMAGSYNN